MRPKGRRCSPWGSAACAAVVIGGKAVQVPASWPGTTSLRRQRGDFSCAVRGVFSLCSHGAHAVFGWSQCSLRAGVAYPGELSGCSHGATTTTVPTARGSGPAATDSAGLAWRKGLQGRKPLGLQFLVWLSALSRVPPFRVTDRCSGSALSRERIVQPSEFVYLARPGTSHIF